MLLWIWCIGALALLAAAVGLVVAMSHAERRARRTLLRALGLDEKTVELLMARNGDVLAELALVRREDLSPAAGPKDEPREPPARGRPAIRLVHPSEPPAASPPSDPEPPQGERRSLPGRS